MEDVEFTPLCADLFRHYRTFDENFQDAGDKSNEEVSFILFGVTGAGKSTAVARALDKRSSPAEFRAKLDQDMAAGEQTSEIHGVHVGHSKVSTTIVPKPYPVGKYTIVDMPGFCEADPKKKIIIDLLQKCYLTRTNKFRILIVAEMGLIYESKMRQLRDGYHRALWRLLGDKYQQAMPHLYFILTKPEQADPNIPYTAELAQGVMDTMEAGAAEDSALFARMLTRMRSHHMVVDLAKDTSETLLDKIQKMLARGAQVNNAMNEVPTFNIEELEAGPNRLNELCVEQMTAKLVEQKEVLSQVFPLAEEWKKLSKSMEKATNELATRKKKALEELKKATDKLDSTAQDLKVYPKRREEAVRRADKASQALDVALEKNKIFKENFRDLPFINVRCDVATQKSRKLGQQYYKIEVNPDVRADGAGKDFMLIMEYEENDDTLRAHIKNNGSLVPAKLSDVTDISTASVLYNSVLDINRIDVERPGNLGSTGCRPIIAKLDRQFKLFIFTERSFATTHYLNKFQKQFDLEVSAAREEITRFDAEIERLDKKFNDDKSLLKTLKTEVAAKQEAAASFQKIGTDLNTSHQAQIVDMLTKVEDVSRDIEACEKDEVVKMVGEVLHIFRANRIETQAKSLLDKFTTGFGSSWTKLKKTRQLCTLFKASDMEEIMDIQGMSLLFLRAPESPKSAERENSEKKLATV